ncbi:MAG: type II secretion system protein GspN [Desulfobulbaceae bacterium]|nr:type II secretion system protein GspN [Desulfobulbaceae bacterium]
MTGVFFRWMVSSVFYLLYTVAVLGGLLWYLFPDEAVRSWVTARLNGFDSELQWKIDDLALAFPPGVVAFGIHVNDRGEETSLLQVDRLQVTPDILQLVRRDGYRGKYQLEMLSGAVTGEVKFVNIASPIELDGHFEELKIEQWQELPQMLQRRITGNLSGRFTYTGPWRSPVQGVLKSDLLLEKGRITFQQPVLGLEHLDYVRISTACMLEEGKFFFEQGRMDAKSLAGDFEGTVQPATDLLESVLELQGSLEPRPELFAGITDEMTAELIRSQLKEGHLPFTVRGSLREPGILFNGLSVELDTSARQGAQ